MVQLAVAIAASLALAVSFSAWADFTGKVVSFPAVQFLLGKTKLGSTIR